MAVEIKKAAVIECWKAVKFDKDVSKKEAYEVSNLGRLKSFKIKKETGQILKKSTKPFYSTIKIKMETGEIESVYLHRLIARAFLRKNSTKHIFVIHKNYDKRDNRTVNLKWVTKEAKERHYWANPDLKRKKKVNMNDVPEGAPLQLKNEIWKPLVFGDGIATKEVYDISNYGRLKSFKQKKKIGFIIKQTTVNDFQMISVIKKSGTRTGFYVHKLVAQTFLNKPSDEHTFVIHRNYKKLDNWATNLSWATKREKEVHQFSNPKHVAITNAKLTERQVRRLKKILFDPNRKLKIKTLAKRYGVSEMQLHRIKSGENWSHIKID